jgi:hypothetical protein
MARHPRILLIRAGVRGEFRHPDFRMLEFAAKMVETPIQEGTMTQPASGTAEPSASEVEP